MRIRECARAHAERFCFCDFAFAETERHQEITTFAGGDIGREPKQLFANRRPDHQRMHHRAKIECIGCGFLDGFKGRFGQSKFSEPREIDPGRAAQGAVALDVEAKAFDRVLVIAERAKSSARVGA